MGGGVLVVFLLCGGRFCVGSGGKLHFQNVTKCMKISDSYITKNYIF